MDDRSETGVGSLGRKWKLLVVIVAVGMGFALFLRLFGIFSPSFLPAFMSSTLSLLGSATFLTLVVIIALSLVIVSGRRRLADCWLWRFLLPHRRTYVMIPSISGDGSRLAINCSGRKDSGSFAISVLRLLSVPREGVRQRVRGAVARDEQQEGAAVSDEKQYQFSHIESLSHSEEQEGCVTYEVQFRRGLVNVGFTVSAKDGTECRRRREQVKANVLSKFPIQLTEASGEYLKDAALMALPSGVFQVEAVSDRVAQVSAHGFSCCVAVVALVGRPEMSAHEQRCQIDQFITGVNSAVEYRYHGGEKEQVHVNFLVSFKASKPPKYPSDASLRERLREKPDVRLSLERKRVEVDAMEVEFGHRVGWWKVSPYAVVLGNDLALVEEKADSVANVIRSVWSGSHFSPDCRRLHSREIVKYLPVTLRRGLLPRRYVTEMSSIRLSSLVHIPEEAHPPLSKVTPPPFEAPDPQVAFSSNVGNGVTLGDVLSPVGGVLYPLILPINALGTHLIVLGESGFGKTCLIFVVLMGLLGGDEVEGGKPFFGGRVPFLVLDQKGEYRCLVSRPEYGIAYFLPASGVAPLWINLFDPQGDDPDAHAKRVFNIIREILFANRTELTPQMERVLYDVLRMSIGGDWAAFNKNLGEYLRVHGGELPQLEATIQGILNRVGQFTRPPLSQVFDCKESNVCFPDLVERSAVIDLSEVRRQGTPEDVRLVANIIGKYVSVASLNRGADFSGELKHLFIVDDALDMVPEVLTKKTTADVGTIEYMAILLRATGQGLVVVSQRPNIAENVMSNSAVKVFFRTVVDAREVASWVNLSEEQFAYLKVLPKREAVISVPQHTAPMRIRIPDVSNIITRKVTNHDIIVNNMINYPLMYDMQRERDGETSRLETREGMRSGEMESEDREGEVRKENGISQGNEDEQGRRQEQQVIVEKDDASRLPPHEQEAWSKLRDHFERGGAIDSEFAANVLNISRHEVHRIMLVLRRAGLVGFTKIPNYAFGEGYQYVYYSSNKDLFGGGVVGYLRERIHSDLIGREVIVEVSPRDVPSADLIVQHSYPLVVHAVGVGGKGTSGLRLPSLNERVRKIREELGLRRGLHLGAKVNADNNCVIVVTLWREVAGDLNEARRAGKLKGCLWVMPFAKKHVETLADYALNQITLETMLGEEKSVVEEAEKNQEKEEEIKENKEEPYRSRSKGSRVDGGCAVASLSPLQQRVLAVVREVGGVEPCVVAERLGVRLPRVSEAVKTLVEEGLVKVARNVPDLRSRRGRANSSFYLDAGKATALHDVVMNEVWKRNIELGGKSRDYSFEFNGKTWHTDGLLENTAKVLLEVVAGDYHDRTMEQIGADTGQLDRDRGLSGVLVVAAENRCLERLEEEAVNRGIPVGVRVFITSLRSKHGKLQYESLLRHGSLTSYHRNPS